MNVRFIECESLATELDVSRFEDALGFRLPDGLRELFLLHNGGRPVPNAIDDYNVVHECIALERGGAMTTSELLVRGRRLVPEYWVPFARDPFGNLFFLDCHTPGGLVYWWNHEDGQSRAIVDWEAFWNKLH